MVELADTLPPRGEGMATTQESAADFPPALLNVMLPGPAAAAMKRAMEETGDSPGVLFGKALGLYLLALDARKRGKAVGAADSPDDLETEFTGL